MYKTKIQIVELEKGDYHTLVKGRIAGHQVRIVLDTGASHTCVDMQFVSERFPELQTQVHDGVTAGIGGDDFEVRVADIPDLKLGRFHVASYNGVALLDFAYINSAYQTLGQKPIQMILGNDFFVRHKAVIDYDSKELRFNK